MTTKQKMKSAWGAEVMEKINDGYIKNNFSDPQLQQAKLLLKDFEKNKPDALKKFLIAFPHPEQRSVLLLNFVKKFREMFDQKVCLDTLKAITEDEIGLNGQKVFTPGWTSQEVKVSEFAEKLRDAGKLN